MRPRPSAVFAFAVLGASGCGGSPVIPPPPASPTPTPTGLGLQPVPLSPVGGMQVSSDRPTFTVQNTRFDVPETQYTFRIWTASGARELLSVTVPAGRGTTSVTLDSPLPRGMNLTWRATARNATMEASSDLSTFRSAAVECLSGRDRWAKAVVDVFLPLCERMPNTYNDPNDVIGPPNAGGFGPFNYYGFLSLGEGGHVTVDMEACTVDQPGPDLRVYQAVGMEEVTLSVASAPNGPFVLVEARKPCGERVPGADKAIRYCDFDLAMAEVAEARYFKIDDGELYPCALADTPSEGADIDAVEILHQKS